MKPKPACAGQPASLFFEDLWTDVPYTVALANAREEFCDTCPVRVECLKAEVASEGNTSVEHRAGIYAGFTPRQRHALSKRGQSLNCTECGDDYDPTLVRQGTLVCSCGTAHVAPIPDRGDQWTDRHTKLARIAIGWLSDNVEVGGEVPDPLALSRQLKVQVKDLRRVYTALLEDHVILKLRGKLVRRKSAASAKHWTPPHLRVSHAE